MEEALEQGVAHFRSQVEGKFEHDGNGIDEVCDLFRDEVSKLGEAFQREINTLLTTIITTQEQLNNLKRSQGQFKCVIKCVDVGDGRCYHRDDNYFPNGECSCASDEKYTMPQDMKNMIIHYAIQDQNIKTMEDLEAYCREIDEETCDICGEMEGDDVKRRALEDGVEKRVCELCYEDPPAKRHCGEC